MIWWLISLLGHPVLWAAIIAGIGIFYKIKRPKKASTRMLLKVLFLMLVISISLGMIFTVASKVLFQVTRPCMMCPGDGCNPYCEPDGSFPSGHSVFSFAGFSSIILASRKWKNISLLLVPVLVSYSRIVLGVHTYTDIFAGAVLGIACAFIGFEAVVLWHKEKVLK